MSGNDAASRAVAGQMTDAMRGAILDEIESVVLDRMEDAGGLFRVMSRARSLASSILGVYGQISDIYDMAVAGYRAYTIPRRKVERVAAAHAFAYWVFQRPGTYPPTEMPIGFQREMMQSDAEDARTAERMGRPGWSRDRLSAADWQTIWGSSARSTMRKLEEELQEKAQRGVLDPPLREALPSARIAGQAPQDKANQYRLVVIGGGCKHSPELAARIFLLGSLAEEDSHWAREAILRFYRRYPYTG